MAVDITIEELTNGELINKEWVGTGIFDKLIRSVNLNIESQRAKGYITGEKYAAVYLGSMQSVIAQSMQFLLQEKVVEAQIEKAGYGTKVAAIEYEIAEATKDEKIATAEVQLEKITADKEYVLSQKDALDKSVLDNRKIKAIDSMADVYGTFGAGGLTLSPDMWSTFYKLIASLTSKLNDYKGEWNANTNTPNVSAVAEPREGDYYVVSVAGTTNLDGNASWGVGEIAVYTGDRYVKSEVVLPGSTTVTKVV